MAVFMLAGCDSANDLIVHETGVICRYPANELAMTVSPQEDLEQNVGDRILFDFDSAIIQIGKRGKNFTAHQRVLERQAAWLKQYPDVNIIIEGHADKRGTREYNLALGERRSNAVKSYLVALGVDANRIETVSYGKERPAVLGSNEEAWSKNRRTVTVVD